MVKRLTVIVSVSALFAVALFAQPISASANNPASFSCTNNGGIQVQVVCTGPISVFAPVTVTVKNTRALDNNEINVLSGDLNNLQVSDNNIADGNKVLNDVDAAVLNDFLNKFHINVSQNDIQACTAIAGVSVCK
jgi:hypothetical protein